MRQAERAYSTPPKPHPLPLAMLQGEHTHREPDNLAYGVASVLKRVGDLMGGCPKVLISTSFGTSKPSVGQTQDCASCETEAGDTTYPGLYREHNRVRATGLE